MSSPPTSEPHHESHPSGGDDSQPDGAHQGTDESTAGEQPTGDEKSTSGEDESGELSLDLLFEILKNSRRREVLRYLKERRERVTLSELAEHVAAIENDTTVQALSSQQRKRVYVGLYQCHLPKLDDMDIVEFNQSRGHVELGPNAAQLDRYLYMDDGEDEERQWAKYYLGYAALSGLLLIASAGAGVFGGTAAVALSAAIVLGVVGLAAVQTYEQSQ